MEHIQDEIFRMNKEVGFYRPLRSYCISDYNRDFEILMKLYRLCKTQRIDQRIDIYFKIKFFRQLARFPFINPQPYMNIEHGIDIAIKDLSNFAFSYFFV